jgi:hypothetical protein
VRSAVLPIWVTGKFGLRVEFHANGVGRSLGEWQRIEILLSKSSPFNNLGLAWRRAFMPPYVDVAIVRAADVAREVVP